LLRHPVERLYSQYRFSNDQFSRIINNIINTTSGSSSSSSALGYSYSFDDLVLPAMNRLDKFGVMRDMVSNGTGIDELVRYYYQQRYQGKSALGTLFMHSIYFPSIHHYIRTFGKGYDHMRIYYYNYHYNHHHDHRRHYHDHPSSSSMTLLYNHNKI